MESLATDPELNEAAELYLQARAAYELSEIPDLMVEAYKKLGLWGDEATILALERAFADTKVRVFKQQKARR